MKKVLFIIIILLASQVNAIGWHEQKRIAKDIGRNLDYDGSFKFAYYHDHDEYAATYRFNSPKFHLITFYKSCSEYTRNQFIWLVLHELGHYDEVNSVCGNSCPSRLNETYADLYVDMRISEWI
jgi:hypothetical protein